MKIRLNTLYLSKDEKASYVYYLSDNITTTMSFAAYTYILNIGFCKIRTLVLKSGYYNPLYAVIAE